jgi:DNA invertase Pin-like site-specific DNA recombinase
VCVLAVAVSPVQRCLRESLSVIKLTKREIAWQREGQIAAAINYQVENLPAGHTAYVIKVQNEWRVICSENGVVVAEFVDHVTGKRSDREQFQRMFEAASRREFDYLVTWALDRLSREGVARTFEHIKQLRSYGIEFISFTEPHFRTTGPAGELMIAVAAWIAEQEHRRISERVRAGLGKARKQGRIGGRRRLVLDYDRLAELDESGLTMREIAQEMGCLPAFVCRALKARQRLPTLAFGD